MARFTSERAMRELTEILDASPDLIVQTDWRDTISYLNPAGRRAVGLPPDGPVPAGLNFSQFNTPETNLNFADAILPAVTANGAWVGQTTLVAQGGHALPVRHTTHALNISASSARSPVVSTGARTATSLKRMKRLSQSFSQRVRSERVAVESAAASASPTPR